MSKINKKKTQNLTPHNNGSKQINEPSFTKESLKNLTKELYTSLLAIIKKFENIDNSFATKEKLINLVESLIDKNDFLNEEYTNKYIQSIYDNNEIYHLFESTLKANEEKYLTNLSNLDLELENEYKIISDNLLHFQQEAVGRYKIEENNFLPKTKFLTTNKKINKEEYIRITSEINHARILANQKYIEVANDLASQNEQHQLKFKHSIESAIEKNIYDKKTFEEQADIQIYSLNDAIEQFEISENQFIHNTERKIIQNTIEVNDLITKLGEEYANRLKYAHIPYDIKSNKLIDELSENNYLYNKLEEKVLDEFKTLLQQNDNEIEQLRENHREFEEKYLQDLKTIKKHYNSKYQKDINIINKNIAIATKKYTSTLKKEDRLIVKNLVAEKKAYINNLNNEKREQILKIKKEYFLREMSYIERFERLRTKKIECEAVKSSAMKNINYERIFHHERINSELKLIAFEKESYSTTDHYEEIKDIYNNRLKCAIENESLHYQIHEKELENYIQTVKIKYQQDKINAEKVYNILLCDADFKYQEETIKNRINLYNVKTMLNIKRESIINEFEVLYANEKMNFEQIKNIFYNNCDNIQYQIYKVSNELTYKIIDTEVSLEQELSDVERQHAKAVNTYKKNTLYNKKIHEENLLHVKLYENRLEVEKGMINDAHNLYINSMHNVMELENFLCEFINTLSKNSFKTNKNTLLYTIECINKIKLRLIEDYNNNETTIIKTRVNFEAGIKFKKQLDNAKKEYIEFIKYSKTRTEKTIQTINSYQETLTLFQSALENAKQEIINQRQQLLKKLLNKKELEQIKKEIKQNKVNISILKKQIKANKNNIVKIKKLSIKQEKERTLREKKYNNRFLKIEKQRYNEVSIYNKELSLIELQHSKLKNKLQRIGQHLTSSKYLFETKEHTYSYIKSTNDLIIELSQHYFNIHFSKINESLKYHYSVQKEIYYKNFERYSKEIKKSYDIENKEYITNKLAVKNAYKSKFDTLQKKALYSKNKLIVELQKINIQHESNIEKFKKAMESITTKKEYELACHDENYEMFLQSFNNTNSNIINSYLTKIKEIKIKYHLKLTKIENKYIKLQKTFKTQRMNNLLLKKNNILNLENENKENIKNTTIKIKKVTLSEKENHQKYEESKKISYKLYFQNQRNARKEFTIQLKSIQGRCEKRIKLLQKEFKKNFKKEH